MDRKGLDYTAMLVIATMIGGIFVLVQLSQKISPYDVRIGGTQVAMLNALRDGEKLMLFIDTASRQAALKTIAELAEFAGFIHRAQADCGISQHEGITYYGWHSKEKDCYPNPAISFQRHFAGEFHALLRAYNDPELNKDKLAEIPTTLAWDYYVNSSRIVGVSSGYADIPVKLPGNVKKAKLLGVTVGSYEIGGGTIGVYAVKPAFNLEFSTGTAIYEKLAVFSKNTVTSCSSLKDDNPELVKCVNDAQQKFKSGNTGLSKPIFKDGKFLFTARFNDLKQDSEIPIIRFFIEF